jgi:hypothetical protein
MKEKPKELMNEHCRTCASACCGPHVNIEILNDGERDFLRRSGTDLRYVCSFPDDSTGKKLFELISKCGYVIKKDDVYQCSVHDDPQRPAICGDFKAGGEVCKQIKEIRKKGVGYEFGY